MKKMRSRKIISFVLVLTVFLSFAAYPLAAEEELPQGTERTVTADSLIGDGRAVEISSGRSFHLLRTNTGNVWWFNKLGSLEQVEDLQNIIAIDAGSDSSLALKLDGTVWQFSFDDENQSMSQPEQVWGLNNIVQISNFNGICMALSESGELWEWDTGESYVQTLLPQEPTLKSLNVLSVYSISAGILNYALVECENTGKTVVAWPTRANCNRINEGKFDSEIGAYVYFTEMETGNLDEMHGDILHLCNGGYFNCWITDAEGNSYVEGNQIYSTSPEFTATNEFVPSSVSRITDVGGLDTTNFTCFDLLLTSTGRVYRQPGLYSCYDLPVLIEDLENIVDVSGSLGAGQIALHMDGTIYLIQESNLAFDGVTALITEFKTLDYFTIEEVYSLADRYVGWYEDGSYLVQREYTPLYDESSTLFAYAVPFTNASGVPMGHINVGAIENGLAFYLIDPIDGNYRNIKAAAESGRLVGYSIPFTYYVEREAAQNLTAAANSEEAASSSVPFTQNEAFFNEENSRKNDRILESLAVQAGDAGLLAVQSSNPPTVAALSRELSGEIYLKIVKDGTNKSYYGGDQSWWKELSYESRTGLSGSTLETFSCGLVAMVDNVLYHVTKDYATYHKLLRYTDEPRMILDPATAMEVYNPNYKYENFNKSISFNTISKSMQQSEYMKILDFYTEMDGGPRVYGMLERDIKSFYDTLKEFTEFTYIRSVPASQKIADVEAFLISKLNNDTPVFMHNLMEWKAQDYMSSINVQSHCNFGTVTWDESPDFDNHWMTVTKYYKNNNTGDKFVAFISWGYRFSINADLLIKNNTQYRPDFYTYELLPKT